ncbi:MAG: single-stranded DNA-binding protein [Candidatus Zambryskibacteria bacterium RIFCSPHIGHO2_01_FULL_43_25]|uniref:Single-stranded DNA-binding protein n=1 Tax=Candidatus Zambryskibacteria bacterium RIFCSPLOWO2_01_FULL_45_21 TaxID=1802761 RepID=A0A1G2U4D0_9BACT|nr:MAG: single-stranded DNA-binding protein [Candidatus Zambryskibacteria bacterium RIFCSPHIGHO2_01_FULL_43_25]OHB00901.1 MAG: single-stranded DNA-binding protein [Candidatus Zambryskibacteria bacterium RIFCSPHIGHO2_12_FULL_44_12b]OHB04377.1 MAG: single-stranded DNA-binding protein [Candidatus Zambryskibacteria bacterium RIFCSPLOWO2_01_FULL_45_21]
MYLNKALVIGNLTRDPESRALPSGVQVATFSVATNRVWKDKNGAKQESADFHNVVVFGRQAETVSQYLKKGSSVLVEGRMQTRSWDASDGTKKYRTEIVADRVQFGPRRDGGKADSSIAPAPAVDTKAELDTIEYPADEINPDDIPF